MKSRGITCIKLAFCFVIGAVHYPLLSLPPLPAAVRHSWNTVIPESRGQNRICPSESHEASSPRLLNYFPSGENYSWAISILAEILASPVSLLRAPSLLSHSLLAPRLVNRCRELCYFFHAVHERTPTTSVYTEAVGSRCSRDSLHVLIKITDLAQAGRHRRHQRRWSRVRKKISLIQYLNVTDPGFVNDSCVACVHSVFYYRATPLARTAPPSSGRV